MMQNSDVMEFCSDHSLAELRSALDKTNPMQFSKVHVNCTEKSKLILEHRPAGFFNQVSLDPKICKVRLVTSKALAGCDITAVDGGFLQEDLEWCKTRVDNNREKDIESLQKASLVCYQASKTAENSTQRRNLLDQAIQICPKLCSLAYLLKAGHLMKNLLEKGCPVPKNVKKKIITALKEGVEAGKNLSNLLKTDEFCKGNLYTFLPTRNYMRSLYMLGSFELYCNDTQEASKWFRELLAHDIHDSLGGRHKLLLCLLAEGYLKLPETEDRRDFNAFLESTYGDDQQNDDIMALWNYTRALKKFNFRGADSKKARKALCHAIQKNPYVPPLLLGWDSWASPTLEIVVGGKTEAADYFADNGHLWLEVEGALDWLETIYCEETKVKPMTTSQEAKRLLVEGTRSPGCSSKTTTTRASEAELKETICIFERLVAVLERDDPENHEMSARSLRRLGLLHSNLQDRTKGLDYFNMAVDKLDQTNSTNIDLIKELLYNRALCKEAMGDFQGALLDFYYVFEKIGKFTTAAEGIQRLLTKLDVSTNPSMTDNNIQFSQDQMQQMLQGMYHSALEQHPLPPCDSATRVGANLERCDYCGRGGISLSKCARCLKVGYCSKNCQTLAWKNGHKRMCAGKSQPSNKEG